MKLSLSRYACRLGRVSRRFGRWTGYTAAGALVLVLALYAVAHALLPRIDGKKTELEDYLTRTSGHTVRVEKLQAYWDGVFPGMHVHGLNVYAPQAQRPSVRLAEVHVSLAPLPLLWGKIEIHSLVLTRPSVTLERLSDKRLRISGFDPVVVEDNEGADEKLISWLLSQRKLSIRDGELQWVDQVDGVERLRLSSVQFDLRNRGKRHRAELSAKLPAAQCQECSVKIDITGNPMMGDDWGGEIYLRAAGLDVQQLPRIVRERMPRPSHGRFDMRLWTEWEQGAPKQVHGTAAVVGLRLPVDGLEKTLAVSQASSNVNWKAKDGGWQLDLDQLTLALIGAPWAAERLRLTRTPGEYALQVQHVDLLDVSRFVAALEHDHPLLRDWSAVRPAGMLDDLRINLSGAVHAPTAFSARADVRRLHTEPHEQLPGVHGVSGRLAMTDHGGELALDSTDVQLHLPRVFRGPIDAQRVAGVVTWERDGGEWRVEGGDLRVTSADGNGTGHLHMRIPVDRTSSPHLKLRVDFRDGNGAHAARYFPAAHLSPATLAWMESAFLGGTVTHGHLIYEGALRDWPFAHGNGRFEIRGHVKNGIYRYLPGWMPVTNADVDVSIIGTDALITGQGKIGTLDVRQVAVRTRPARNSEARVVAVSGKVNGAIAEKLRVLRAVDAPSAGWRRYIPADVQAEGAGSLSLELNVALRARAVGVAGEYRVNGAALKFPSAGFGISAIAGDVGFTDAGIQKARLTGRVLGGDALVTADRAGDGRLALAGRGRVAAAALARLHGAPLAEQVSGAADWTLAWRERTGLGDWRIEATLDQIKTRLPAPLDYPGGLPIGKLVIHTEQSRPDAQLLDVRAGDIVRGKLAFAHERGDWRFVRGHVGFGLARVVLPVSEGLQLSARLAALDVDQWLPFSGDSAGPGAPSLLKHVSAEVKQFEMFDRRWGRLFADVTAVNDGWRALLDGDAAAGKAAFVPARGRTPTAIRLDLAYLRLPDKKHRGQDTPIDPAQLPALDVRARSFEYNGRAIGEVDFSAVPIERGWRISRFNLARPEMKLASSATWRVGGQRHTTELDLELSASDLGKTLEAFGASGQLAGGKVELRSHLVWPGSPTNPKLAGLDGRIEVAAEKGRFLQFDPGAARLFGLLDLNSIARYLTLDFTSAFGKGFAYDKIHGTVTVDDGHAYTRDLIVKGPSAGLSVEGRVGLVTEDYDLMLGITPQLSDTLTFTSWGLFGPQAAAAVLALQKLFRKQIAKGTQVTYTVQGPWKNPTVTKVAKRPEETPPPPG